MQLLCVSYSVLCVTFSLASFYFNLQNVVTFIIIAHSPNSFTRFLSFIGFTGDEDDGSCECNTALATGFAIGLGVLSIVIVIIVFVATICIVKGKDVLCLVLKILFTLHLYFVIGIYQNNVKPSSRDLELEKQ